MIKLRKHIKTTLLTAHPRVFFYDAPETAVFPYIVYDFPNSFVNEEQEVILMDVDVWDDSSDTTELETIAGDVWQKLHKHHHIDEDIQLSIHRTTRFTVTDADSRIKRRKMIFEVRYYDRRLTND